jgi:hypothetical protein
MDAVATLVGLAEMHPELEWQEITAATAALFDERGLEPPYQFKLDLIDVPGFGSESLHLSSAASNEANHGGPILSGK